ncbi:MAG: hypothetical protein A3B27_02620 [Candidatus Taylorbacteria bacterium RIFCSPLOWO2_01_FULL_50_130]|nr:MAG: hypothetical protein A3B27_02620 [Candidatus Taylorbacteria bacterium RIFCSPLOWO2_01_FULL_50_130]
MAMEIDPNELKKLRSEEGLRNPDDIFDLSNREGVANEVLRENIHTFTEDVANTFQQTFKLLLEEYKKRTDLPSDEIIAYLANNKLDKPNFIVASNGENLLAELGFSNERVNADQIPVSFQLPKPLAQFWYKGGTDSWGALGRDVGPNITEWGHFYRKLMEIVWEKIGYYESEKGLVFERVNGIGDHNPKSYYYIWKISRWGK